MIAGLADPRLVGILAVASSVRGGADLHVNDYNRCTLHGGVVHVPQQC